jgi:mRNA interferase YafQ
MKYKIEPTNKFKKDLKLCKSRGYDIELIRTVIKKLSNGEKLEDKYKDHDLKGNWSGYRECHVLPDWLLVYKYNNDDLILILTRTGSHSDLFR